MKTYSIFDIHTHTYPERIAEKACVNLGAFYEFIVEGKGTYADLEESARPHNVKGFLLFYELDCDVTVCLNLGLGQILSISQSFIIGQNPVMGQGKNLSV